MVGSGEIDKRSLARSLRGDENVISLTPFCSRAAASASSDFLVKMEKRRENQAAAETTQHSDENYCN